MYVRGICAKNFDEEKFMNSRSFDEFVVEDDELETLEDAEDLIEKYELAGEAIEAPENYAFACKFGVLYDGVNALEDYDQGLMGHCDFIVYFEAEYLSENLQGDGDIVKPLKVLRVEKNENV